MCQSQTLLQLEKSQVSLNTSKQNETLQRNIRLDMMRKLSFGISTCFILLILYCTPPSGLFSVSGATTWGTKGASIQQHTALNHATKENSIEKQRGKKVSAEVSAKELYEAYEELKHEYNQIAFHPSSANKWKVIKETKDDVEVSLLEHANDPSCPYVRMKVTVDGTTDDIWGFLELKNWEKYMPKMDPFYDGVSILGNYDYKGVNMKLARKRTTPLMGGLFGRRDFTFISVSDLPRLDGTLISGTISVITEKLPRQEGYTRAYQDSVAFYENIGPDPTSGNPRALLTIVTRIDLNDSSDEGQGGGIPMWLYIKTIGSTGVLALRKMRNEVKTIFEERLVREANQARFQPFTVPKFINPWNFGNKTDLSDTSACKINRAGDSLSSVIHHLTAKFKR